MPGLVDWFAIPSDAEAKVTATIHMLLNVTLVVLFFVSWLLLGGFAGVAPAVDLAPPLILQVIGVVMLGISGWLGGELVFRHHVGVAAANAEEARIVEQHERRRAAYTVSGSEFRVPETGRRLWPKA